MRERGSALLASFTAILILLLISGIFFSMIISRYSVESSEEKGLKAYYLAEAGIQYGIAEVLNGKSLKPPEGSEVPIVIEPVTINNPFDDPSYEGSFTVHWEDKGSTFIVQSKATYNGVIRQLEAEFSYPEE